MVMRAHVHARALAALVPALQPLERALSGGLVAKVDERGGAAERGRLGAGAEGVHGMRRSELPVQMGMHVHATGQHQQASRIVHFDIAARRDVLADSLDAPVDDQDVGGIVVHRRDDPAVADQRLCHLRLLR
jgi:hypothetical protein